MGNVSLPTPVAVAGGVLCILAGYLLGVVTNAESSDLIPATVQSFDSSNGRLCLTGDGVEDQPGVSEDGHLCGTWRNDREGVDPREGDDFLFVSTTSQAGKGTNSGSSADDVGPVTVIYGDVVS